MWLLTQPSHIDHIDYINTRESRPPGRFTLNTFFNGNQIDEEA